MPQTFKQLTDSLLAAEESITLVGIDGPGGAGKSTLTKKLCDHLPDAAVVHVDDFYRVMAPEARAALSLAEAYRQNFDWQRLERQVLAPLSQGRPARYERYDWPTNRLAESHDVEPRGVILVEGVGSLRPELRGYYNLKVWVAISEAECMRRMIARGENPIDQIEHWAAVERFYAETFQPKQAADVVIAGGKSLF